MVTNATTTGQNAEQQRSTGQNAGHTTGQAAGQTTVVAGPSQTRVRLGNWSHGEIIALITCKQKEHAAQKQRVDPRAQMIPAARKWKAIATELQALTHATTPRGPKHCKDKWNGLNTDYRKVVDYGKGSGNHTSYWNLTNEEKDRLGLPRQFNCDFFDGIEAFQGERNINTPIHLRDSQVASDGVFSDTNLRPRSEPLVSSPLEWQGIASQRVNDDFDSQTPVPSVIRLSDTPLGTPLPLAQGVGATSAPGSTQVKRKRTSAFKPVMDAADKSSKVLVEAMDRINNTQLDLEKARTRSQTRNSKQQLAYLKVRDQKAHKMSKNMVQVLSNLSTAMCHAFIKDPALIPPAVHLSQSSEEPLELSLHVLESTDEELSP